jgi:hypothetical protein
MFHVEHPRPEGWQAMGAVSGCGEAACRRESALARPARELGNFPLMLVKVLHAARCACMLGQDSDTLLGVFHVEHASKSDGSGRMPTMHGNGDRR